jgi:hypothetical protein
MMTPEEMTAIFAAIDAGDLPEASNAKLVQLLGAELMLLTGAALAACEAGDIDGLYRVLRMLSSPKALPGYQHRIDGIEAKRAAQAAKIEELRLAKPAKAAGPSPWGNPR